MTAKLIAIAILIRILTGCGWAERMDELSAIQRRTMQVLHKAHPHQGQQYCFSVEGPDDVAGVVCLRYLQVW